MDTDLARRIERRKGELITLLESLPPQETEGDMDDLVAEIRAWRRMRQRANAVICGGAVASALDLDDPRHDANVIPCD